MAVYNGTLLGMKHMDKSLGWGGGHVVNVSSITGQYGAGTQCLMHDTVAFSAVIISSAQSFSERRKSYRLSDKI